MCPYGLAASLIHLVDKEIKQEEPKQEESKNTKKKKPTMTEQQQEQQNSINNNTSNRRTSDKRSKQIRNFLTSYNQILIKNKLSSYDHNHNNNTHSDDILRVTDLFIKSYYEGKQQQLQEQDEYNNSTAVVQPYCWLHNSKSINNPSLQNLCLQRAEELLEGKNTTRDRRRIQQQQQQEEKIEQCKSFQNAFFFGDIQQQQQHNNNDQYHLYYMLRSGLLFSLSPVELMNHWFKVQKRSLFDHLDQQQQQRQQQD